MKSKKVIQLIQEADPDGNTHVCVGGFAIIDVSRLPAYYDGALKFVVENKDGYYPDKLVITDNGDKISIDTITLESFVWDKESKDSVILDLQSESSKERYTQIIDSQIKKAKQCKQRLMYEALYNVLNKLRDFVIVQPIDTTIGHCNQMYYLQRDIMSNPTNILLKDLKKLNQGECGAVLNSGFFNEVVYIINLENKETCYVWEFINI